MHSNVNSVRIFHETESTEHRASISKMKNDSKTLPNWRWIQTWILCILLYNPLVQTHWLPGCIIFLESKYCSHSIIRCIISNVGRAKRIFSRSVFIFSRCVIHWMHTAMQRVYSSVICLRNDYMRYFHIHIVTIAQRTKICTNMFLMCCQFINNNSNERFWLDECT